jgi:hypothetical protein
MEGIMVEWFVCLDPNPERVKENGGGWFWVVPAILEPISHILEGEEQACFEGEWWRPKHLSPKEIDAG